MFSDAGVPDIAIRWIVQYSCDTNSNLATVSNVNRHWRTLVHAILKDMLVNVMEHRQIVAASADDAVAEDGTAMGTNCGKNTFTIAGKYKRLSKLLLPEMAFEIIRRYTNSESSTCMYNLDKESNTSFCLAWFPPEGIQVQNINLDAYSDEELFSSSSDSCSSRNDIDDDDNNNNGNGFEFGGHYSSRNTVETGKYSYEYRGNNRYKKNEESEEMAFYRERLQQKAYELKSSNSNYDGFVPCSYEWRGYSSSIDILAPLGYSSVFVKSILHLATDVARQEQKGQHNQSIDSLKNYHNTTYAVRGAVLARPHSFCLCWDADQAESKIMNQMINLNIEQKISENAMYKLKELRRRKKMHDRVRRRRMREVLPRVIVSSPMKNPVLQDPQAGILDGRKQRCLQFLNADGSRAVYLRTPPFACGPVKCPVTMFCVGIATEDGCFVSGLENRFELGHLHGIDQMDKSIDMSPICICAEENIVDTDVCFEKGETGVYERGLVRSYSEDMSDSSCDDYQIKRKGSILCQCQMQYQKKFDDDSLSEKSSSKINQANIMRGQIGPGRWHCYTAIIDGAKSTIRVDGCTEKINNTNQNATQNSCKATLDGLTIGSDHCFEMPLCFGAGSEGEGEGSIAELAVFNGALPIEDVEKYERHLMRKHGIIHGQWQIYPLSENNAIVENVGNQWQEDLWRRQAHAMIVHPPHHEIGGASIPLRVAAKHRSVAWHRCNEVTGRNVKVSRIGSKQSHGSSDW